jgi:acyl dehydratase
MPPRKLYFENVRISDELPAQTRPAIDRVQLARYAGATMDFNPLHVDEVHARALGMPSVMAPSSLGMGFLAQLVTDWARGAQVRRLSVKFARTVWPGDVLSCKGRVSDRHGEGGRYLVDLDVWAENQRGELVVKGQITLKVFYSAEDESRARAGQPALVVNVPRESILAPALPPAAKGSKSKAARSAKVARAKPAPAPAKVGKKSAAKPLKKR